MKALSVLVLRYKRPEAREWKVPLNFRIGSTEIPLGLILITLTLFVLALINVVTKKTATISGSIFTVAFFTAFALSERHNLRKQKKAAEGEQEKFRVEEPPDISLQGVHVRPGNILVEVNDPGHLEHLQWVLKDVNPEKQDTVAVAIHRVGSVYSSEYELEPDQIFCERERELFSKVVSIAEKAGKHVELLAVPGRDECTPLILAAQQLRSSRIVVPPSPNLPPDEQARRVGKVWEQLPPPRPSITLEILSPDSHDSKAYSLGPHVPHLWPGDIELAHRIWQELSDRPDIDGRLHHRDVFSVALRRLDRQLHSRDCGDVLADVEHELAEPWPLGSGPSGHDEPR